MKKQYDDDTYKLFGIGSTNNGTTKRCKKVLGYWGDTPICEEEYDDDTSRLFGIKVDFKNNTPKASKDSVSIKRKTGEYWGELPVYEDVKDADKVLGIQFNPQTDKPNTWNDVTKEPNHHDDMHLNMGNNGELIKPYASTIAGEIAGGLTDFALKNSSLHPMVKVPLTATVQTGAETAVDYFTDRDNVTVGNVFDKLRDNIFSGFTTSLFGSSSRPILNNRKLDDIFNDYIANPLVGEAIYDGLNNINQHNYFDNPTDYLAEYEELLKKLRFLNRMKNMYRID